MNTKIVTPNDWLKFREIRLAGLTTDPQAFGGNLADEATREEADWRKMLASDDRFFLATEEHGFFVSVAGAKRTDDKSWMLIAVYTPPQYRGQGLSQRLIEEILDECEKRGACRMGLMVNTDQKAAIHVYERADFKIMKTLTDEKMGDGKLHDEFLMEKLLKA